MDRHALRFALELHGARLEPCEVRHRQPRRFRRDDIEANDLALAFHPARDVDAVADGGIVEAALESHIPHQRIAGRKSDADGDTADGAGPVELVEPPAHRQCGLGCAARVIGDVDRRIPERHDRIADEFVDGARARHDLGAQRAEHRIEQPERFLRTVRLGEGGKAAHVGEHHRDLTRLAAELQLTRARLDAAKDFRRHVVPKGPAQFALVAVGQRELKVNHRSIDHERPDHRERRVDQPAACRERRPRHRDDCNDRGRGNQQPGDRSEPQDDEHQRRAGKDEHQDLEPVQPVGAAEELPRDDLLDHRGVDQHAGDLRR